MNAGCQHTTACDCSVLKAAMERVIASRRVNPAQALSAEAVCLAAGFHRNQRHLIAGDKDLAAHWAALKAAAAAAPAQSPDRDRVTSLTATVKRLRAETVEKDGVIEGLLRQLQLAVALVQREETRAAERESVREAREAAGYEPRAPRRRGTVIAADFGRASEH